jgi:hypothetical protein
MRQTVGDFIVKLSPELDKQALAKQEQQLKGRSIALSKKVGKTLKTTTDIGKRALMAGGGGLPTLLGGLSNQPIAGVVAAGALATYASSKTMLTKLNTVTDNLLNYASQIGSLTQQIKQEGLDVNKGFLDLASRALEARGVSGDTLARVLIQFDKMRRKGAVGEFDLRNFQQGDALTAFLKLLDQARIGGEEGKYAQEFINTQLGRMAPGLMDAIGTDLGKLMEQIAGATNKSVADYIKVAEKRINNLEGLELIQKTERAKNEAIAFLDESGKINEKVVKGQTDIERQQRQRQSDSLNLADTIISTNKVIIDLESKLESLSLKGVDALSNFLSDLNKPKGALENMKKDLDRATKSVKDFGTILNKFLPGSVVGTIFRN